MKKLFTLDDFMVAFITALCFGFGETIARVSGWPEPVVLVVSFILGLLLEESISKIVYNEDVQKNKTRRTILFVVIIVLFCVAQYISMTMMGASLLEYLQQNFLTVVGLPILGFIVNLCIRGYRVKKIRKVYGDGSEGYVFNLKEKDIEETNRQNQQISGSYKTELAVRTRTGIYVGEKYQNTIYYLGIPYAKPPVGELRWKAPEPLPSSDSVYEAKSFGPSAIQVDHQGSILKNHRQSEDCLYLNVCTGNEKSNTKKPVMVVFHHGDFTYGGAADPLLYGTNYINKHPDTVFVSFNYRLGIFGFIDFSEVPGGEACPDALNLGLLDQIAALRWVKENIAAFGGDPEKITVLGFDSGATSILLLAASQEAKRLFQKAFVFNGSPAAVYDTPECSRNLAKALLKETGTSTMNELMRLDTEKLKDVSQKLWKVMSTPACDGTLIPADIYRAYQESSAAGIDFIIGIPNNESSVYRSFVGERKYEEMIASGMAGIQDYLEDSLAAAIQKYIEEQTAQSSEAQAKNRFFDQWIALCIYLSAQKLASGGNKVNVMYWDKKALIDNLGSGTVDAAAALLGNNEALEMYGNVLDEDLSEILQSLLQKFITGEALQLYTNEIKGVDAIDWLEFPNALIISDEKITCNAFEDKLSEIEGLLDFVKNYK